MPILFKSEIQFLQGQKQISKFYEYKLKSIIKKKISDLIDKEIPLITTLFPNLDLTKFSKTLHIRKVEKDNLTTISKVDKEKSVDTGNSITLHPNIEEKPDFKTKFYILNNINNQSKIKAPVV
jgi:hypothetical protein